MTAAVAVAAVAGGFVLGRLVDRWRYRLTGGRVRRGVVVFMPDGDVSRWEPVPYDRMRVGDRWSDHVVRIDRNGVATW